MFGSFDSDNSFIIIFISFTFYSKSFLLSDSKFHKKSKISNRFHINVKQSKTIDHS